MAGNGSKARTGATLSWHGNFVETEPTLPGGGATPVQGALVKADGTTGESAESPSAASGRKMPCRRFLEASQRKTRIDAPRSGAAKIAFTTDACDAGNAKSLRSKHSAHASPSLAAKTTPAGTSAADSCSRNAARSFDKGPTASTREPGLRIHRGLERRGRRVPSCWSGEMPHLFRGSSTRPRPASARKLEKASGLLACVTRFHAVGARLSRLDARVATGGRMARAWNARTLVEKRFSAERLRRRIEGGARRRVTTRRRRALAEALLERRLNGIGPDGQHFLARLGVHQVPQVLRVDV